MRIAVTLIIRVQMYNFLSNVHFDRSLNWRPFYLKSTYDFFASKIYIKKQGKIPILEFCLTAYLTFEML